MVAELTDIPVANAERKTPTADPDQLGSSSAKPKNRPKWIEAATREPIYSVLDSNDDSSANNSSSNNVKNTNVVVISAVKSEKERRRTISSERREFPYEEDEEPLYSVVRKPKKVRLSESSYYQLKEKKLQPGKERPTEERQTQLEVCSRQEELRRWLQVASEQLPEPRRRLFSLGEMYTNHHLGEFDQLQADWKRNVAMPRGIVGLVGPYRVYQNPNERREYMLQEEELVEEEVADSVSEIAACENNGAVEHHQRAKWRIREDDEETLVPDIRNIASLEGLATEADNKESPEWRRIDDRVTIDYSKNDEALRSKELELEEGNVEGIVSGREERAVDVPEEASTASTSSMTDKNGERPSDSLSTLLMDREPLRSTRYFQFSRGKSSPGNHRLFWRSVRRSGWVKDATRIPLSEIIETTAVSSRVQRYNTLRAA